MTSTSSDPAARGRSSEANNFFYELHSSPSVHSQQPVAEHQDSVDEESVRKSDGRYIERFPDFDRQCLAWTLELFEGEPLIPFGPLWKRGSDTGEWVYKGNKKALIPKGSRKAEAASRDPTETCWTIQFGRNAHGSLTGLALLTGNVFGSGKIVFDYDPRNDPLRNPGVDPVDDPSSVLHQFLQWAEIDLGSVVWARSGGRTEDGARGVHLFVDATQVECPVRGAKLFFRVDRATRIVDFETASRAVSNPEDGYRNGGHWVGCIDLLGENDLCILPGSWHGDGEFYEWGDDQKANPDERSYLKADGKILQLLGRVRLGKRTLEGERRRVRLRLEALHLPEGTSAPLPKIKEIKEAIAFLNATEYGVWIAVGMALHHFCRGGYVGLQLWVEWSRTCPEKFGVNECCRKWDSFSLEFDDGRYPRTINYLFLAAKEAGFLGITPPPPPRVEQVDDLDALRRATKDAIADAVQGGKSLMLAGPAGSGKTEAALREHAKGLQEDRFNVFVVALVGSHALPVRHRHVLPARQCDDGGSAVTLRRRLSGRRRDRSRATGAIRR